MRSSKLWNSVRALAATALLASALAATQTGAGAQAADPRFFSQTGYRVDTDPFWTFFQGRGGIKTFGYPVSRTFKLDGFQVQIFQRIVMQLQPDGSVATLNLLDPGLMPYTQINGSTFPAPDPAIVSQTPPVSDPDYATKIIQFTRDKPLLRPPEHRPRQRDWNLHSGDYQPREPRMRLPHHDRSTRSHEHCRRKSRHGCSHRPQPRQPDSRDKPANDH